jgi:uncharacterized caspase-like protein
MTVFSSFMLTGLLTTAPVQAGLVTGSVPDLEEAYRPRRIAVVVGVEQYADPNLQGLRFAKKDATDLAEVLENPSLGNFDRVMLVTESDLTTADKIIDAIEYASADLQRDDTFLLYLSGHGTLTIDPIDGSQLFFLGSDGNLDHPRETGLSIQGLEERMSTLTARRRVLIMDTCHNGRTGSKSALNSPTTALLQSMRGEPPAPRNLREVSESEARLFAAQYHQPAMEDPDLQNGVYTHFLLQALTGKRDDADLDRDGLVDVTEAHDFARDHTIHHTGGMQVPRAEYRIVGHEEIYLSGDPTLRKTAERALLTACDQILAQAKLLVDGIPRGGLMGATAVQPGIHEIEIQNSTGETLIKRKVRFEAGTTLPIESLFEQRQARWLVATGPSLRHGHGRANFHPIAGELEVAWVQPVPTASWMRPDIHLRAAAMNGTIPEQGENPVMAGDVALGGTFGLGNGPLTVGPLVEGALLWRTYEDEDGEHRQVGAAPVVGVRALLTMDVGNAELALRMDSRLVPYQHDGMWTSLWHHGLAVGVVRRP